jgi:hypothetical protein
MSRTSIFACLEPRGSQWQLGPLPPSAGRMMLIGWKQEPAPVDGGVPEDVAAVLAHALTSIGRVTFPSSSDLTSTTDAKTSMQAFDDPAHPWWLQGQVLLVSAPAAAPPRIDRARLLAVLENDWAAAADALGPLGVIGIVRPGVDGDVAGVFTLTADAEETTRAALERETRRASFDWFVLTEEAFAERYTT